jgi:putative hemin transport protein
MVFAGNRGCIEIHSGPIERVVAKHGWLNVLDPGFNLHVRETGIARAWVVHKPSEHGVVSSLEVFEPHGENIAMLFAHRKDGATTVDRWKDLLRTLE